MNSDAIQLVNVGLLPIPSGHQPGSDSLLLSAGRIEWIGSRAECPDEHPATVIDCKGRLALPGLMDLHVHLVYRDVSDAYSIELERSIEEATLDAAANADRLLSLGFTTVRDVGTRGNIACVVRDAIDEGRLRGPQVRASQQIISSWGTGDYHPTHIFQDQLYSHSLSRLVNGPWEVRKAVRQQAKDGVDWIKIEASGTGFNPFCPAERTTLTFEEIAAAVDEAADKGLPVSCHAESSSSILRAANAGVNTIEHAIQISEDAIDSILSKDIAVCPTLGLYSAFAAMDTASGVPRQVIENHKRTHASHVQSLRRAVDAGVSIVAGSDSGILNFPQGGCLEELCLYVELLGMSEEDALASCTSRPAEVLGFKDRGEVSVGLRADLVVFESSPLEHIRALTDPRGPLLVIKAGEIAVDRTKEVNDA